MHVLEPAEMRDQELGGREGRISRGRKKQEEEGNDRGGKGGRGERSGRRERSLAECSPSRQPVATVETAWVSCSPPVPRLTLPGKNRCGSWDKVLKSLIEQSK